jgi:FlaA1/EpsC-like NDP-sugar epimerase
LGEIADLASVVRRWNIDEVIVTMIRVPRSVIRRVVQLCEAVHCPVRILPAYHELIDGSVTASRIREIDVADLLGREESKFDDSRLLALISGKCVLISGAGGSIGRELVRQVARMGPARLVLLERSEYALYEIDRQIRTTFRDVQVIPVIGDVCDDRKVSDVLSAYRPHLVLHAAAYKHVPMMELNVLEAVRNNVLGTRTLGEAALRFGVERFVLISTDKAVNPVSVMGMTKRLAEIVVQDLNRREKTRFSAVRFGNVLDSSGSVVPLFREQIRKGGPVTVTHPEMQRYFMTVEEAAHLVLQATTLALGGEIYVLDMGEPMRIVELAEEMIRLSGLKPYEDIPIAFTGVRLGEKLFEELDVSEASVMKTENARIYIGRIPMASTQNVAEAVQACERLCQQTEEPSALRGSLSAILARVTTDEKAVEAAK